MSQTPRALIVDDEADIRELLEITLARMGLDTNAAGSLAEARALLAGQSFALCLTDMRLPDGSGVELVREINAASPGCPVAVITAYGNTEAAVDSLKAGAFDFVNKPVDVHVLRRLVDQALKLGENTDAPTPAGNRTPAAPPRLLGNAPAMRALRATIDKLARSQAPVYVTGESGTGKELVARTIHERSPRAGAPFVPVNCGAIPAELMESELFGHTKGAFTGANTDKKGLFAAADGGTLFLDEIAELPLAMQVKLLRAIQERAVRPVGAEHERGVDARLICATHADLAQRVRAGSFRQDLYYRLNVIEVHVPALRERPADIPELAEHILAELGERLGLPRTPRLSDAALAALGEYHYPGNVRELENILERAVTLCEDNVISPDYLRLHSPLAPASPGDAATPNQAPQTNAAPAHASLDTSLEELERQRIRAALERTRHNKTKAAELLGISFRALRYRLKKLGID